MDRMEMRLKLFRAPAMADAMRQVRAALGPDALILSSRRVADGVEITAGLETEAPAPVPPPALPAAAPAAAALEYHGASAALRRKLAGGPLPFALSAALRFATLPLEANAPPVRLPVRRVRARRSAPCAWQPAW